MIRTTRLFAAIVFAICGIATTAVAEDVPPAAQGPFVIRSVDFEVKGITRDFLLRNKVDIRIGTSFPSKESLDAFVEDRRQVLVNERVLESVEASYDMVAAPSGGQDVALHFLVKDSWNIIALPYFKYDSNTGLLLSVRGRDYNFLGSMQTLSLNLNYTRDEALRSGFGISTSFTLPFLALDHEWSLGVSDSFAYYPDGTPTTSTTSLSLGVTFRELGFPITLSGSQGLSFNPDGDNDDPDRYFLSENVTLGASMHTGLVLGGLGSLDYAPQASFSYNWRFGGDLLYASRQGSTLTLTQALSLGRADWFGNQRKGLVFSLSNTNTYYAPTNSWTSYVDFGALIHENWRERIGITTHFQAFARLWGATRTSQGAALRGIKDDRVSGEDGVFLNLDLPVKLFDFPTHLVIKKNWLDFELQASPFLDLAVVKPLGASLSSDNVWYSGGLEVRVFPVIMRSFIVRASIGFDLDAVLKNKSLTAPSPRDGASPYELFFGLGLHY